MTALVGGYVPNFSHVIFFRIRQRTPFSIVHFDLKVPVVSVGGRLALATGGAAPFTRSLLWAVAGVPLPLLG